MRVEFTVDVEPFAKQRPRFTRSGVAYTPKKTVDYEKLIRAEYIRQCSTKLTGDVSMKVIAGYSIPKSVSKKKRLEMLGTRPHKKPDVDNILKAIADALNGIAYDDDAHIYKAGIEKVYSEKPYIYVEIEG